MAFKFEKLEIWQSANDLSLKVSELVDTFPSRHQFGLGDQLSRAADSVCNNIAEGSTGQTNREQQLFLKYAFRSVIEVVSCLFLGRNRKLISNEDFHFLYDAYEILVKRIITFRKSIS